MHTHIYIYIYIYVYTHTCLSYLQNYYSYHQWCKLYQEPQKLSPPPTSGFPQVEENIGTHRKTENSLAAGIRGWG